VLPWRREVPGLWRHGGPAVHDKPLDECSRNGCRVKSDRPRRAWSYLSTWGWDDEIVLVRREGATIRHANSSDVLPRPAYDVIGLNGEQPWHRRRSWLHGLMGWVSIIRHEEAANSQFEFDFAYEDRHAMATVRLMAPDEEGSSAAMLGGETFMTKPYATARGAARISTGR